MTKIVLNPEYIRGLQQAFKVILKHQKLAVHYEAKRAYAKLLFRLEIEMYQSVNIRAKRARNDKDFKHN